MQIAEVGLPSHRCSKARSGSNDYFSLTKHFHEEQVDWLEIYKVFRAERNRILPLQLNKAQQVHNNMREERGCCDGLEIDPVIM